LIVLEKIKAWGQTEQVLHLANSLLPLKDTLHSLTSEHEGLEKEWSVVQEQAEEVLTHITSVERKKRKK